MWQICYQSLKLLHRLSAALECSAVRISIFLPAGTSVGLEAWHFWKLGRAHLSSWAGPAWHWDADTSTEIFFLSLAHVLRLFQGAEWALPR